MDKFKLTPLPGLMWTVEDKERGIKVSFREGLFNETQEVELKDNKKGMETAAKAMREIGEWLASEHRDVAVCDFEARARAIQQIEECQLLTITAALNSVIVDWNECNANEYLLAEVEDYLDCTPGGLDEESRSDLLGSLSLMDGDEALELARLIKVYWDYKAETLDICIWARDAMWYPAWVSCDIKDGGNEKGRR